jgi:hypothetical protein
MPDSGHTFVHWTCVGSSHGLLWPTRRLSVTKGCHAPGASLSPAGKLYAVARSVSIHHDPETLSPGGTNHGNSGIKDATMHGGR